MQTRSIPTTVLVILLFAHLHSGACERNFGSAYDWIDYFRSVSSFDRRYALHMIRNMFNFAYGHYMQHAFPADELDPIHCTGRGHDHEHPDNLNINDALGDYQLTLIDSLDTLAIMGHVEQFKKAVALVIKHLSFDRAVRVQVFEATIRYPVISCNLYFVAIISYRILGGLLSAHLLITDPSQPFGDLRPVWYDDELLVFAHDLANRMLNAFDVRSSFRWPVDSNYLTSATNLPYPRFYLGPGLRDNTTSETCLSGAGSLLLEFGCLSALLNDPTYASISRRVVLNLWSRRSSVTGLLGATIDVNTGNWIDRMSGIGAGHDSFYEYLHKSSVLFGDRQMGSMFEQALHTLRYHLRTNGSSCLTSDGQPSVYWNLDMYSGRKSNYWIDSLQAMWPGLLVTSGDVTEAVCQHALHYFIWRVHNLSPERYDISTETCPLPFYPLRPELAESTYFLYRATGHPFYLHVGKQIMESLKKHAKARVYVFIMLTLTQRQNLYCLFRCGFATIHNVADKSQEDRMESFFLSETLKYLYLLFDESNPVNRNELDYVFSTQAHLFPVRRIRSLLDQLDTNPFSTPEHITEQKNSCPSPKLPRSAIPLNNDLWLKIGTFVNSGLDVFSS
ncbi:glycosyl hydrolase family 47, partial [Opisthorchis viverrini]